MVGSPNRVNQPGQATQVAEQNTAAVVGPQGRQSAPAAARPPVPQVTGQGQPDDMNGTQAGRQSQVGVQNSPGPTVKGLQRGERVAVVPAREPRHGAPE